MFGALGKCRAPIYTNARLTCFRNKSRGEEVLKPLTGVIDILTQVVEYCNEVLLSVEWCVCW